jgi:hypothetical protein
MSSPSSASELSACGATAPRHPAHPRSIADGIFRLGPAIRTASILLIACCSALSASCLVQEEIGTDGATASVQEPSSSQDRRSEPAAPDQRAPRERETPERPYSGEWIERDGSRFCDGYLTRRADQDFCVAKVPDDWVPFEFGGKTYYMQPLTGQD